MSELVDRAMHHFRLLLDLQERWPGEPDALRDAVERHPEDATRLCDFAWRLICRAYGVDPEAFAQRERQRFAGAIALPQSVNRDDLVSGLTALWEERPTIPAASCPTH